jgi:alkylation response protein AidB-like acyl-CoA dehydrogenase
MTDSTEYDLLRDAVARALAEAWPPSTPLELYSEGDRVAAFWRVLAEAGQTGLAASAEDFGLKGAILAVIEHGRGASPAPLVSAIILNHAASLGGACPASLAGIGAGTALPALAYGAYDGDAHAGAVSFADGRVNGVARFVEDAGTATQLAVFTDAGIALVARGAAGVSMTEEEGLNVPAFHSLAFDNAPADLLPLDGAALDRLAVLARLLYVARALGAARRAFTLAVEHVSTRKQFGQYLAQFQAMQHKLANAEIALRGTEELVHHAATLFDAGDADWRVFAEAAVAFGSAQLRHTSIETHHAFGAVGYAEEHEAPRHFRRVHADLCRMGGAIRAQEALVALVAAREGGALPGFDLGEQAEAFRAELRDWLATNWTEADREAEKLRPRKEQGISADFSRKLGAAGLLSLTWQDEHGAAAKGPREQLVLVEEMEAAAVPAMLTSAASWLMAPEIIRHGTPQLKAEVLPGLAQGEVYTALGYSEPEAGSDLTSLRTRAVRDGDDYLITGQKLWGTGTEWATHILLAARTDPDIKPKAKGISLFVVPTNLPGITIQPQMAFYGHTFCTQFYDEVRVPSRYLLGREGQGWSILSGALATERVIMGGTVLRFTRLFDRLLRHLAGAEGGLSPAAATRLGGFAAELLAARLFALRSILTMEEGRVPVVEGAVTKVFTGELAERFCEAAVDLTGTTGLIGRGAPGAILDGMIELELRTSLMLVIGGGAAEIQRTIIAQMGLGMPR